MGTNYYLARNAPTVRPPWHIGKNSHGWLFHFQAQDDRWAEPPVYWQTYTQVKDTLKRLTVDSRDFVILNEYDEIIPFEQFCAIVEAKQRDEFCKKNRENFKYGVRNVDGYRFSDEDFL